MNRALSTLSTNNRDSEEEQERAAAILCEEIPENDFATLPGTPIPTNLEEALETPATMQTALPSNDVEIFQMPTYVSPAEEIEPNLIEHNSGASSNEGPFQATSDINILNQTALLSNDELMFQVPTNVSPAEDTEPNLIELNSGTTSDGGLYEIISDTAFLDQIRSFTNDELKVEMCNTVFGNEEMESDVTTVEERKSQGSPSGGVVEAHADFLLVNYVENTASSAASEVKPLIFKEFELSSRPFVCGICESRFISEVNLYRHYSRHKEKTGFTPAAVAPSSTPDSQRGYECKRCGSGFDSLQELRSHLTMHSRERPHPCGKCSKTFWEESALAAHMRSHEKEKSHRCTLCDKSFVWRGSLRAHLRTHTGERPFPCPTCKKAFSQKSTLMRHLQRHAGEKLFSCDECGRSFGQKYELFSHWNIHSGKHTCDICGIPFKYEALLNIHRARMHQQTQNPC